MLIVASCGKTDEPESPKTHNPISTKILGNWSGGYSYSLDDNSFSYNCILTFREDGLLENEFKYLSQGGGSMATLLLRYEIEDDILHCGMYGDYKITLYDDFLKLSIINKEIENRIWGGIKASINGVNFYETPDEVVFKRIK